LTDGLKAVPFKAKKQAVAFKAKQAMSFKAEAI